MQNKTFFYVVALAMLMTTLFVSCHDDDDVNKITDEEAGYFEISLNNKTYIIQGEAGFLPSVDVNADAVGEIEAQVGDTIRLKFVPKDIYVDSSFKTHFLLDESSIPDFFIISESYSAGDSLSLIVKATHYDAAKNEEQVASNSLKIKLFLNEIENDNVGTIEGVNISSGEDISNSGLIHCFVGDTLKFRMNTEEKYPFKFMCDALTQINDSMFIVPSLGKAALSAGLSFFQGENIEVTGAYDLDDKRNEIHLSATIKLNIVSITRQATFPYHLSVSQDLLQFVNVKVKYTDENGNWIEKNIGDDEWTQEYTTIYTYVDANGSKHSRYDTEEHEEGWTLLETEQIALYPTYSVELNYQEYGFRSSFIVSYSLKNNQMDLTEDRYKFSHSLSCNPIVRPRDGGGKLAFPISISISIGDTSIKKKDVQTYLDNLVNNPDEITFEIDKDGNVKKIEPTK